MTSDKNEQHSPAYIFFFFFFKIQCKLLFFEQQTVFQSVCSCCFKKKKNLEKDITAPLISQKMWIISNSLNIWSRCPALTWLLTHTRYWEPSFTTVHLEITWRWLVSFSLFVFYLFLTWSGLRILSIPDTQLPP